tara:strand:+ start:1871 stop:4066 length:2196 start_codon:yes stop_codon:yes gene_type:complete
MIELIDAASKYIPDEEIQIIRDAYDFANRAHTGQNRLSGEPYIEHPLNTSLFLAELHMDSTTLAAALLHDVVEDCDVKLDDLSQKFGPEVTKLVDGVTKLNKIDALNASGLEHTHGHSQAESLRKMLVAMAQDIRVVLIKLADRLHNLKTLNVHPRDKRETIARETLDIYAPLAHRLGIWDIKWRLEDLAFSYIEPEKYKNISELLSDNRSERESYITSVCDVVRNELKNVGIKSDVNGRPKHIYSIHKKMEAYGRQGKQFGEIYDLFALRILVEGIQDCYSAIGVVHSLWHPIRGEFDDYIANPKENRYKSLHTAVMYNGKVPLEVQIRTYSMHQLAEYGVAAHWRYKEGTESDSHFEEKMTWMRQLLDWQRDVAGAEEFLESVKTDIFQDQVFAYTPKGDVVELPIESTPIDFAYRIHTDLGHRCIGAKINAKLVPLYTHIQNGDTVDIVISKIERGPSLDWLNADLGYANTANSRQKIKQWFKRQAKSVNIQRGQEILNKELRHLNLRIEEDEIAKLFKMDSRQDLLSSIGNGNINISQLTGRLLSQHSQTSNDVQTVNNITWPSSGIEVLGVGDLLTRVGQCCTPIPGDDIIGYITRSRGVSVHRTDCVNIINEDEKERLIQVDWGKTRTLYPIRLIIEAWDRVGLLRDITTLVSQDKINIASIVSTESEDNTCTIALTVFTTGVGQLSMLFSRLEGIDGIFRVFRGAIEENMQKQSEKKISNLRGN